MENLNNELNISEETIKKIESLSISNIPDNPSAMGKTPKDIKEDLFGVIHSATKALLGDLCKIKWVKDIATASSDEEQLPPNTEAVKIYINSTEDAIKSVAVGTPTLSGQELVFPNLNGEELTRVPLPSGGYSHLPLQRGNSFRLQEVAPKVYRARVWKDVDDIYCSYGTALTYMGCANWSEVMSGFTRSNLRVSTATVPIHKEWTSVSVAQDVSVSFQKNAGYIYFHGEPEDEGDGYYLPSHDWYVEIEVDLNQMQCVIKAFQCNNY